MSQGVRKMMKVLTIAAVPVVLGAVAVHAFGPPAGESAREDRVAPAALVPPSPPPPPAPAPPPHPHEDRGRRAHASRAWLGVVLQTDEDGVTVRSVAEGSPAEAAGVREGDRIRRIGGKGVDHYDDLQRAMRDLEPGQKVKLVVDRDGRDRTLDVTLGESPRRRVAIHRIGPDGDGNVVVLGGPRLMLGVDVHAMSSDLRRALNAPEDTGVLVNRVLDDTPARLAGIQAGDVILEVNGDPIRRAGDIRRALRDLEAGDRIPVKVVRDRGERTLDVTLEESEGRRGAWPLSLSGGDEDAHAWAFGFPEGEWPFEISEEVREDMRRSMEEMRRQIRENMDQLREQMQLQREELRLNEREIRDRIREQLRLLERREVEARQVSRPSYDI